MKSARAAESHVAVNGSVFLWKIHREPQWCTADGWKGLAISVEQADIGGRQLLIELPFSAKERRSTPHRQRPKVNQAELQAHIEKALEVGWAPDSRGKPFILEVTNDA
nr:hypothetical protein [uncultured Rhodoferax sp.]